MTKKASQVSRLNQLSIFVTKNKFSFLTIAVAFFLRFPSLFEPMLNDSESYLITYSANLLPGGAKASFLDWPLIIFAKTSFFLFGTTLWSVKFFLLIYFLLSLFVISRLLLSNLVNKAAMQALVLFALVFSLPYFGTNQLNLSLFAPLLIVLFLFLAKKYHLPLKHVSYYVFLLPVLLAILLFLTSRSTLITYDYYQNFLGYATARLSNDPRAEENYFASFSDGVRQTYSLAFFAQQKTSDSQTIFVVGNQNSIYFLANRTSASRNVLITDQTNVAQTVTDLSLNKPSYVFYDQNVGKFGELDTLLNKDYNLAAQENDVKIYSRK